MSGEYQLRKDVDRIIDDIYDLDYNSLKLVPFKENSPLRQVGVTTDDEGNYVDVGTIDAILEYYDLLDIDKKFNDLIIGEYDIDLSGYVSEEELNTILSSYVTSTYLTTNYVTASYISSNYASKNHTHSNYVLRSELSDLDIELSTLELVDIEDNPNGVICFKDISKTVEDLADYVKKSNTSGLLKNDGTVDTTSYLSSLPSHNHDDRYYTETEVNTALSGKQDSLVSGTNIKTINNTSLLGSGNITIQGGGGGSVIATGSFSIDNNGHLIVELPDSTDNPYFINNNGHLIYDTSNTYNGD